MNIASKEQISDYFDIALERIQARRIYGSTKELALAEEETARHTGQDVETVRRVLAERAEVVA